MTKTSVNDLLSLQHTLILVQLLLLLQWDIIISKVIFKNFIHLLLQELLFFRDFLAFKIVEKKTIAHSHTTYL